MAKVDLELVVMRQLASYLAMPIWLVDLAGSLIFYNESAEAVLGYRFEETGEMTASEWSNVFAATDDEGRPLGSAELPLAIAVAERRPAQRVFWICGLDNVRRRIELAAFPLIAGGERPLGALAVFWTV